MKKNVLNLKSIFFGGQTIPCKLVIWLVSMCTFLYKFVSTQLQLPIDRVEYAIFLLSILFGGSCNDCKPIIYLRNKQKFYFIVFCPVNAMVL